MEHKNYWQHRISHEGQVSYILLDKYAYLSIGWSGVDNIDDAKNLINFAQIGEKSLFRDLMNNYDCSKSKWSLYNFLSFKKDDVVVVPRSGGYFSIVKVKEIPETVYSFSGQCDFVSSKGIFYDGRKIDIGFLVKVEKVCDDKPRKYAQTCLKSRMKARTTTNSLYDLGSAVENAIESNKVANIHDLISETVSNDILNIIKEKIDSDDFERLIASFMLKKGASISKVLAKNSSNKENGADADILAIFDDLHLNIFIQAKLHNGFTSNWAVQQISRYKEQREKFEDVDLSYQNLSWVISTGSFDDYVKEIAMKKNVRLIDGIEFVKMLLDAGISDINSYLID